MRAIPLAVLALLSAHLVAQAPDPSARFRIGMGFAVGELDHRTDNSLLDGEVDAMLSRFQFEGTSRKGFGGGVRFEYLATDDDLFTGTGFTETEARMWSSYAHFTYRFAHRRFAMPVRMGLLFNLYELDEQNTDIDITYGSLGPYFEVAPEFDFIGSRNIGWSIYGEFGAGITGTAIDIDNDSNDYTAATAMFGVEVGTRARFGPAEIGFAFVSRWQTMDESDEENGLVVLGYDADFQGFLFTMAVVL